MEDSLKDLKKDIESMKTRMERSEKPDRFGIDDFIQQVLGAFIVALPISMTEEIWEISQKLSLLRVSIIMLGALVAVYFFIKYSRLQRWETEDIGGLLPLRLVTSFLIAFVVSSITLYTLGIYPNFLSNVEWFLKTSLLVTIFSIVGSLGVDMVR